MSKWGQLEEVPSSKTHTVFVILVTYACFCSIPLNNFWPLGHWENPLFYLCVFYLFREKKEHFLGAVLAHYKN